MKRITAILTLLTLSMPLAAQQPQSKQQPQQRPDPAKMFMQGADLNQDGRVTREEFLKPGEEQFRRMDRNHDGVITSEEAAAFTADMQKRMEQMRKKYQQSGHAGGQQRQGSPQSGGYGQYPPQR